MSVIYWLIPAVIIVGFIMVGVLIWAIRSGQYDDLEGEASRIIMDDDDHESPPTTNNKSNKDGNIKS